MNMEFGADIYSRSSEDLNGDIYRRMSVLQDKLRKSEEQRMILEEKFNILMASYQEEHDLRVKNLHHQYTKFLEECKVRNDRNENILRSLEKVESCAALLIAKTERLKQLRNYYDEYLKRIFPDWKEQSSGKKVKPISLYKNLSPRTVENLDYVRASRTLTSSVRRKKQRNETIPSYVSDNCYRQRLEPQEQEFDYIVPSLQFTTNNSEDVERVPPGTSLEQRFRETLDCAQFTPEQNVALDDVFESQEIECLTERNALGYGEEDTSQDFVDQTSLSEDYYQVLDHREHLEEEQRQTAPPHLDRRVSWRLNQQNSSLNSNSDLDVGKLSPDIKMKFESFDEESAPPSLTNRRSSVLDKVSLFAGLRQNSEKSDEPVQEKKNEVCFKLDDDLEVSPQTKKSVMAHQESIEKLKQVLSIEEDEYNSDEPRSLTNVVYQPRSEVDIEIEEPLPTKISDFKKLFESEKNSKSESFLSPRGKAIKTEKLGNIVQGVTNVKNKSFPLSNDKFSGNKANQKQNKPFVDTGLKKRSSTELSPRRSAVNVEKGQTEKSKEPAEILYKPPSYYKQKREVNEPPVVGIEPKTVEPDVVNKNNNFVRSEPEIKRQNVGYEIEQPQLKDDLVPLTQQMSLKENLEDFQKPLGGNYGQNQLENSGPDIIPGTQNLASQEIKYYEPEEVPQEIEYNGLTEMSARQQYYAEDRVPAVLHKEGCGDPIAQQFHVKNDVPGDNNGSLPNFSQDVEPPSLQSFEQGFLPKDQQYYAEGRIPEPQPYEQKKTRDYYEREEVSPDLQHHVQNLDRGEQPFYGQNHLPETLQYYESQGVSETLPNYIQEEPVENLQKIVEYHGTDEVQADQTYYDDQQGISHNPQDMQVENQFYRQEYNDGRPSQDQVLTGETNYYDTGAQDHTNYYQQPDVAVDNPASYYGDGQQSDYQFYNEGGVVQQPDPGQICNYPQGSNEVVQEPGYYEEEAREQEQFYRADGNVGLQEEGGMDQQYYQHDESNPTQQPEDILDQEYYQRYGQQHQQFQQGEVANEQYYEQQTYPPDETIQEHQQFQQGEVANEQYYEQQTYPPDETIEEHQQFQQGEVANEQYYEQQTYRPDETIGEHQQDSFYNQLEQPVSVPVLEYNPDDFKTEVAEKVDELASGYYQQSADPRQQFETIVEENSLQEYEDTTGPAATVTRQPYLAHILDSESESYQIEHGNSSAGNEDSDFDYSIKS